MSSLTALVKRVRGDKFIGKLAQRQEAALADQEVRLRRVEVRLNDVSHHVAAVTASLRSQAERLDTVLAGLQRIEKQLATLAGLQRIEKQLATMTKTLSTPQPYGISDRERWSSSAQTGELNFHAKNFSYRADDDAWQASVDADWRSCGLTPQSWTGKTVVDVGAGSRLRTLWFDDVEIIVIEPLADRFREEVAWCDIDRAAEVYSVPGEVFVPEVAGRADVVVSINALDHGYDMAASVANIRKYLKPDGQALLSLDLHDKVSDEMHPMIVTHPMMLDIFARVGLEMTRTQERARYHGGVGPGARHYWLRPAGGGTVPT